MKRTLSFLLLWMTALVPLRAQEKASPEARMRDALRGMALQIRNLQTERDDLTIKKEQAQQQVKTLDEQVKLLNAKIDEQAKLLNAKIDEQGRQLNAKIDEQGRQLTLKIEVQTNEITEVKIAVARLEGPRPRLVLSR